MDHVVKESLTCKVFHTPNRAAERVVARVKDASLHQGLKSECSPVCHHGGARQHGSIEGTNASTHSKRLLKARERH